MTANDSATYEWTVSGMDCASCAGKVRGAVERLPGVSDVDVALMTERLRLTLDEGQTPRNGAVRRMRTSLRFPYPTLGSGSEEAAPLGESGGAGLLVGGAVLEVALRWKVVVDRGMN